MMINNIRVSMMNSCPMLQASCFLCWKSLNLMYALLDQNYLQISSVLNSTAQVKI